MKRETRVNPFEIALWAVSAVLTIGGVGAQTWAIGGLGQGGGPSSEGFVATQLLYTLGPSLVTAGLIAVVVALALRAATVVVARHAASLAHEARITQVSATPATMQTPGAASPAPGAQEEAPLPFEQPRFRQRQRAIDHSAFKRPGTD